MQHLSDASVNYFVYIKINSFMLILSTLVHTINLNTLNLFSITLQSCSRPPCHPWTMCGSENVSLHSSFSWYKTEEAHDHKLLKLVPPYISERGLVTFSPPPPIIVTEVSALMLRTYIKSPPCRYTAGLRQVWRHITAQSVLTQEEISEEGR